MIDRDGNHICAWDGVRIHPKRGKTAPECCSEQCAKDYATDMGHPDEWEQYRETQRACSACGRLNGDKRYKWCEPCRDLWKATKPPTDTSFLAR